MRCQLLRTKIKSPARYHWASGTALCRSNHDVLCGVAPGTKDMGVGGTEKMDGGRSLCHGEVKWSVVNTQDELCAFQQSCQLTDSGVRYQEWGWRNLLCDLLQHWALVSTTSEDDMHR